MQLINFFGIVILLSASFLLSETRKHIHTYIIPIPIYFSPIYKIKTQKKKNNLSYKEEKKKETPKNFLADI